MAFNFEILKDIRQKKGFTLAQASQASGYTASFLSQLERGLKEPSLTTLRKLSDVYSIPLTSLFMENDTDGQQSDASANNKAGRAVHVIRKDERKEIIIPKVFTICEFVTPMKTASEERCGLSGYIVNLKPSCWISEKQISHVTDESTYIISGKMKAIVGKETHYLNAGDSIYIEANILHNFQNCGKDTLQILNYTPLVI